MADVDAYETGLALSMGKGFDCQLQGSLDLLGQIETKGKEISARFCDWSRGNSGAKALLQDLRGEMRGLSRSVGDVGSAITGWGTRAADSSGKIRTTLPVVKQVKAAAGEVGSAILGWSKNVERFAATRATTLRALKGDLREVDRMLSGPGSVRAFRGVGSGENAASARGFAGALRNNVLGGLARKDLGKARMLPSGVAGARAGGGPVEAGRSYLVGERGPEIVTFRQNGFVFPNGWGPADGDMLYNVARRHRRHHAPARHSMGRHRGRHTPRPHYARHGGHHHAPGHGDGKHAAANGAYLSELAAAIRQSAKTLGIDPVDLATVISYETAGTFDPWKKGPRTRWGEMRGLIQWGAVQRRQYGIYKGMPVSKQMEAVTRYLKAAGVGPGMGILDIYSAVNAGHVGRYNANDGYGTMAAHVARMIREDRAKARILLRRAGGVAGARAEGGPVEAGRSYLVGERGPEVVTLAQGGYVYPNGFWPAPGYIPYPSYTPYPGYTPYNVPYRRVMPRGRAHRTAAPLRPTRPMGHAVLGPSGTRAFLDYIALNEGTEGRRRSRGYNTVLGYGKFGGGNADLTHMTLRQAWALGERIRHDWRNRLNSSAIGRYQIVNQTGRSAARGLGLDPDRTLFSPEIQDRMAVWIAKHSGGTADGLRRQWASLQRRPKREILHYYHGIGRGTPNGGTRANDGAVGPDVPHPAAGVRDVLGRHGRMHHRALRPYGYHHRAQQPGGHTARPVLDPRSAAGERFSISRRSVLDPRRLNPHLPAVIASLREASRYLPPGYRLELGDTLARHHGRYHPLGMALDFAIYDDKGRKLANYQNSQNFRLYEAVAQNTRKILLGKDPYAAKHLLRWGGYFTRNGRLSGYGANDLMHLDLGGSSRTAAGNWEHGLTRGRGVYDRGGPPSQGMGRLDLYRLPAEQPNRSREMPPPRRKPARRTGGGGPEGWERLRRRRDLANLHVPPPPNLKPDRETHVHVYLDGRKVAQNTTRHQTRMAYGPARGASRADSSGFPHMDSMSYIT